MNRYIEVPTITYDSDTQNITGKPPDQCNLIEVTRFINPKRIESYREAIPGSDFREDNKIWTEVGMESGDSFIVNMPVSDFETLLKMTTNED